MGLAKVFQVHIGFSPLRFSHINKLHLTCLVNRSNELDDLRYLFKLGKKNWWRLLTGKIVDWSGAGVSAIATQTIAQETVAEMSSPNSKDIKF